MRNKNPIIGINISGDLWILKAAKVEYWAFIVCKL